MYIAFRNFSVIWKIFSSVFPPIDPAFVTQAFIFGGIEFFFIPKAL